MKVSNIGDNAFFVVVVVVFMVVEMVELVAVVLVVVVRGVSLLELAPLRFGTISIGYGLKVVVE